MNLADLNLAIVYINLAKRGDRRARVESQLSLHGLTALRQPGIDASRVRDPWGFQNEKRYACSLAKRLAIRRGFQTGADAVLMLEDDIVIHPDFREILAQITLPNDWQIFYLGCRHLRPPRPAGPGLLRCTQATDNQALIIRRTAVSRVLRGLSGIRRRAVREILYSDEKLSRLHRDIPAYAVYPNLIWQSRNWSDASDRYLSNYSEDGRQNIFPEMMAEVDDRMWTICSGHSANESGAQREQKRSRVSGGTSSKYALRPSEEFTSQDAASLPAADKPPDFSYLDKSPKKCSIETLFPCRFYINLDRRDDRREALVDQFRKHSLQIQRFAAVDGRVVRNARHHGPAGVYACRLSHRLIVRQARSQKAAAVLICEDDAVLHPDFRKIAEALPPPEDWGIVFFGCTHVETPAVVAPGWVRVKKIWSLHAYGVRDRYYDAVLSALNAKGEKGRAEGADVVLSRLADRIPMYAVYPNISWQAEGYSDLRAIERKPFRDDGSQNRLLEVVRPTNRAMRDAIDEACGIARRAPAVLRPESVYGATARMALWNMERKFPFRRYINLEYRTDRKAAVEVQLAKLDFVVERFNAVPGGGHTGGGTLTKGQTGCALSHCAILEEALNAGAPSALIFEDDVVIHRHLPAWAESVELPDDWGILYFGCQHTEKPEKAVAAGLLKITGAHSTHAYAVNGPFLKTARDAIQEGIFLSKPCDVVLAGLQKVIPTYAFYPNLAWQAAGHSDLKQAEISHYSEEGVQRWHQETLFEVDRVMREFLVSEAEHSVRPKKGPIEFRRFWMNFDYQQASGKLGAGLALLFEDLQAQPLVVGSVFGHDPQTFDILFSGECLPDLQHDGRHFLFREIKRRQWGRAAWSIGTPFINHPRALHVPLFYLRWAERLNRPGFAVLTARKKEFGVSAVIGNLRHGSLAAKRAALAHELSRFVPVHGSRALAAVAPAWSKMIYHDVPDKLDFISQFTHNLCFENHSHTGYLTEKIFDAIHVGAVPLYRGDPCVGDWFEESAFHECTGCIAQDIAEVMHRNREQQEYVAARREGTCKVSLEEMRERTRAFQALILDSL